MASFHDLSTGHQVAPPAAPPVPPYVPILVQPYVTMDVLHTRVAIKVLRRQSAILENLWTKLNTGRQQNDVFDDKVHNPNRRRRRSTNLLPQPEYPRNVRAHHEYDQRDHKLCKAHIRAM